MKSRRVLALVAALLLFITPASAVTLPVADRAGAAQLLIEAGRAYLQGDDARVLLHLDEALKKNTYLIDAYLLRALTLRRQGRMKEAEGQIASFLEVQAGDHVAMRIRDQVGLERQAIDHLLAGHLWPEAFFPLERTLLELFDLPPWRFPTLEAPHQPVLSSGRLFLADPPTKKVHVFFHRDDSSEVRSYALPHAPRAVLPEGGDVFLVLDERGNLYRGDLASKSLTTPFPEPLPVLDPSDAAFVAVDLLALADWKGQRLLLCHPSSGIIEREWSPPSTEERSLFDPLALSVWGPYLAVVDRGNERIYLLELPSLRLLQSLAVSSPLDLLLLGGPRRSAVLTSTGDVLLYDLLRGEILDEFVTGPSSRDLWSLFGEKEMLHALSFNGRKIAQWSPRYGAQTWPLFVVTDSPSLLRREGVNFLNLHIEPFGPQAHLVASMVPSVSAAWLDKALQPRVGLLKERTTETLPLLLLAEEDVAFDFPSLHVGKRLPSDPIVEERIRQNPSGLILDGRLEVGEAEAKGLLSYCLFQGIPIHLWALQIPTALQMNLVRATGGQLLFADEARGFIRQKERGLDVEIPLQRDLVPEGRLSASLLALYIDAGVFSGKNWLPLWNFSGVK